MKYLIVLALFIFTYVNSYAEFNKVSCLRKIDGMTLGAEVNDVAIEAQNFLTSVNSLFKKSQLKESISFDELGLHINVLQAFALGLFVAMDIRKYSKSPVIDKTYIDNQILNYADSFLKAVSGAKAQFDEKISFVNNPSLRDDLKKIRGMLGLLESKYGDCLK